MFKAVNNLREQKGFTLIELLIVIAIIGILAAIAIPAFLGQREKAKQRSMEASAKGMMSEVQAAIDDYSADLAMVFLTDADGTQRCYESAGLSDSTGDKRSCEVMFPNVNHTDGTDEYNDLGDVLGWLQTEHNTAKEEVSPYDGGALVVIDTDGGCDTTGTAARVTLCNTNNTTVRIVANASSDSNTVELFSTLVSSM